ncbi:MAG TPA: TadE family protein [Thermoleophilaceae bacterium]|nr:TadE family protein [Thermoleophilaceae bacterium]
MPLTRVTGPEAGQASVEFVASIPALIAGALIVWQLALAGHALWLVGNAARVAARADLVGRDPRAAARSALPRGMERGLRVERRDGAVRVRLRVPFVHPRWRSPVSVSAEASLGGGG